ncbi:MAG: hypothetical protein ACKO1M_15195 [Planctomycetota bacterium]
MNPNTFAAAEEVIDKIANIVDDKLDSAGFKDLRDALERLGKVLGPRYSASLQIVVDVFDRDREQTLPLLTTGFSTTDGAVPYRIWGDSSAQRYLCEGDIHVVPHDHCPKCWGYWDFKFEHPRCPSCGLTLGQGCKVLLDSDVCPHCDEGRVTNEHPTCDRCGYRVNPDMVSWG